jgi:hypothetical protein
VGAPRGGPRLIDRRRNVRPGGAILTHPGDPFDEKTVAAAFVLNRFGRSCGLPHVAEPGVLETPIVLTNTLCVPRVADALLDWSLERQPDVQSVNPLVGESNHRFLNDFRGRAEPTTYTTSNQGKRCVVLDLKDRLTATPASRPRAPARQAAPRRPARRTCPMQSRR